MKRTVDSSFTTLDENLNLNMHVRLQAQGLHNKIRELLTRDGLVAGSFLQGSFARKTMLKPLKDVDIVCLLPNDSWNDLGGPEGPGRAMESFKAPLEMRWPGVKFDAGDKPAAKALRVAFPGIDFTIDLVPAFGQTDNYVLIGDRFEGTWELSNTRIQLQLVSERNQQADGRFVHYVREAKELTKHHKELDFVCGIVVESMAYEVLGRKMPDKEAITRFLVHAKDAVMGRVIEPGGDDDVIAKWTSDQRQLAAHVYGQAARMASEARALERAGDRDAAIDVWHSLFGDAFPSAPVRSVHDVLGALAAGSVTSSGRPSTTRAARQLAAPGRSWSRGPCPSFRRAMKLGRWTS